MGLTIGIGVGVSMIALARDVSPPATEMPFEVTSAVTALGETYTLGSPMKNGRSLNGVPFTVSDQAGSWSVSSTPSTLYGSYRVDGAMFDPRFIGTKLQGFNESWKDLTGSLASAAMPYGGNIEPNVAGPFAITPGMCGRIVQVITDRAAAPAAPDGTTWDYVKKHVHWNIVPAVPPAGAICPIFDGAGGVEWLTTHNTSKNIFKGSGYAPGQTTLEVAIAQLLAAGFNPNFPFYNDNGECRRVQMPKWSGTYSATFAPFFAKIINACHAVGAANVPDQVWYWLLTIGAQIQENAKRGFFMPGGAGQNNGQWMFGLLIAIATKRAEDEARALAYNGNERNQQAWVTSSMLNLPVGWVDDIGYGVQGNNHDYNRIGYQPGHLNTVTFKVSSDMSASPQLWDSGLATDYQGTSGEAGAECFAAALGFMSGRGGKDASEIMLGGGPNDHTNPMAAPLAYWNEYAWFHDDLQPAGSNFASAAVRAVLRKRIAEAAVAPVPQPAHPFTPQVNQTTYWQAGAAAINWNYSTATISPLAITRYDNRLSMDGGRTFKEFLDCGVSGTLGPVPLGLDVFIQNRFWNSAGTRGWGFNDRRSSASGRQAIGVLRATGAPSGTPVNEIAPKFVTRGNPNWRGRGGDSFIAVDTVAAGTIIELGLGWWPTGDASTTPIYEVTVEGVQVASTRAYATQPGDASIEGWVTIGGVRVKASNIVNDIPLAMTSAATRNVNENAQLSHQLTATRPATFTIRTSAQHAASVDHAQFEISGSTLRWVGNGTKDFEDPKDTADGGFNTYTVVVRATNAYTGTTVDQAITVTVTDIVEGSETYYPFTGASGTALSAVPGITLAGGEERLQINASNALGRRGVTVAGSFYREGVNTSGIQRAGLTFAITGTSSPHIVLFGSWSGGKFTGYALYPSAANTLAVRKYVAGVGSTLGTLTVAAIAAAFEFEAIDTGTATELKVYAGAGGAQQGATVVDSSGTRLASGYNGLYLEGTSSSATTCGDDFRGNMQF